jgi:type IV pilus biogenesis/stability protein PilW
MIGRLGLAMAVAALALSVGACGGTRETAKKEVEHPLADDPAFKVRMAESLMKAGRVREALEHLDEAVAKHPDNAPLRLHYGRIALQAGRFADAEASFRKALEIDPYLTDARNYLGAVLSELGRFAEAEEQFERALQDRAYPTPELLYLNLGLLRLEQHREEQAIEALRRAVEIDPKFYRAHYELAAALEGRGDYREAVREYEVAAPGYRTHGDYFYRLGFLYYRLGDESRARDHLARVLTVAPGSESAARADELLQILE